MSKNKSLSDILKENESPPNKSLFNDKKHRGEVSFISLLKDKVTCSEFECIPDDLKKLLENESGIMNPIVENLKCDKFYKITVIIEEVNKY